MRVILRNTTIWCTTRTAAVKLITLPNRKWALHTIKWCGRFESGEKAALSIIDRCNKKGYANSGSPIPKPFGKLAKKRAGFIIPKR